MTTELELSGSTWFFENGMLIKIGQQTRKDLIVFSALRSNLIFSVA